MNGDVTMIRWTCQEEGCDWWREVPAISTDYLIQQGREHMASHAPSAADLPGMPQIEGGGK